jgi:acyl carrier protein
MYYLPEWSSLAHVQIIVAIEDHWSIEVPEDQIVKLISIPRIVEYIAARNL